jgi:hypothetical protein
MMKLLPVEREFEGRTAFVLGGSSGIGLATARLLAERGANVSIVGHADDTLIVAKQFTDDGLKAVGLFGDASQSAFVSHAIDRTVEAFGGLDILVCSAAIHPVGDVLETDEAPGTAFAVGVKSMYLTCHYGVPHDASQGGSIITVASVRPLQHARCLRLRDHGAYRNATHPWQWTTRPEAQHSRKHDLPVDHHADAGTLCKANGNGTERREMYREFAKPVPLDALVTPGRSPNSRPFSQAPGRGLHGAQFTADGGLLAGLRIF